MSDRPRIAVLGAGANGGAIAASLTRAGEDVVAIDPWPAHVEAIRRDGLTITAGGASETTDVVALHVCELAEQRQPFDVVVLGVKAYDTRWACELIKPYVSDTATIVAVQNGVTLDIVADVFGADRSVGSVIEVAANLMTPARIEQEAPMWLALGGETPTAQSRAEALTELLAPAASTVAVDDIRSAKWMKLVANACELVPSAILDLPLAEAARLPGMHEFMLQAGQEALDTALAAGHQLVPIFDDEVSEDALTRDGYVRHLLEVVLTDYTFPDTLTTVLQDWRKGRRAEIEELNGLVVATGEGTAQTPANERILELARRIERGRLVARPENAELLLRHTAQTEVA